MRHRSNSTKVMLSYIQTCMEVDFTFYGYTIILFFLCPLFPSLFTWGISHEDSNIMFLIFISSLIMRLKGFNAFDILSDINTQSNINKLDT